MPPLVALDVGVPQRAIVFLDRTQLVECFEAGHGSPDEVWVPLAIKMGARLVVTADVRLVNRYAPAHPSVAFAILPHVRLEWRWPEYVGAVLLACARSGLASMEEAARVHRAAVKTRAREKEACLSGCHP